MKLQLELQQYIFRNKSHSFENFVIHLCSYVLEWFNGIWPIAFLF